jgi:hypothetical protein
MLSLPSHQDIVPAQRGSGVADKAHSAPSDGVTTQAPDGEQDSVSHWYQQPKSEQSSRQFWASTEVPVVLQ